MVSEAFFLQRINVEKWLLKCGNVIFYKVAPDELLHTIQDLE